MDFMVHFTMGTGGHCITMLPTDWSISTSHDPLPSSCHSEKMLWNPSIERLSTVMYLDTGWTWEQCKNTTKWVCYWLKLQTTQRPSGLQQTVLVTFHGFRKLSHRCTEEMFHSSSLPPNIQVHHCTWSVLPGLPPC